jgi:hypothetical protein
MISIAISDSDPAVEGLLEYLSSTNLSQAEQGFLLERTRGWLQVMEKHSYSATASVVVDLNGDRLPTERQSDTVSRHQREPQVCRAGGRV